MAMIKWLETDKKIAAPRRLWAGRAWRWTAASAPISDTEKKRPLRHAERASGKSRNDGDRTSGGPRSDALVACLADVRDAGLRLWFAAAMLASPTLATAQDAPCDRHHDHRSAQSGRGPSAGNRVSVVSLVSAEFRSPEEYQPKPQDLARPEEWRAWVVRVWSGLRSVVRSFCSCRPAKGRPPWARPAMWMRRSPIAAARRARRRGRAGRWARPTATANPHYWLDPKKCRDHHRQHPGKRFGRHRSGQRAALRKPTVRRSLTRLAAKLPEWEMKLSALARRPAGRLITTAGPIWLGGFRARCGGIRRAQAGRAAVARPSRRADRHHAGAAGAHHRASAA